MMELNLAAYQPISTIDDFGYSTSVVFFRGCDLSCWYCHNSKYREGDTPIDIKYVEEFLMRDSILTSSVTLSGGEPLLQLDACKRLIVDAHTMGKQVCLYTNGNHPQELKEIIKDIDRIYIDWKAERVFKDIPGGYDKYLKNVMRCLSICEEGNVEVIITYVAFNTEYETVDEIEDIKAFCGGLMFCVIQGTHKDYKSLTPEEMKLAFTECHIRTRENGVEWNG